jgi:hypothetical protein
MKHGARLVEAMARKIRDETFLYYQSKSQGHRCVVGPPLRYNALSAIQTAVCL